MAELAELQSDLDELQRAKRSGVLIVRHGEKMVTYRSMQEILRAIADTKRDIDALVPTRKKRQMRVVTGRGT
ncbi:MAG: hypothetical protein Q7S99_05285 [Parvibaculum sp.]|nr:hypothetical protein [Parvibaculum sp.]